MFVSESALNFMGTKVQVINAEGEVWDGHVDPSSTVENVKKLVFEHFYPGEVLCGPENFRLIYTKESRTLSEGRLLHDEKLAENNALLFVKKRPPHPPDSDKDLDLKTPTAAEIAEATKDLGVPVSNKSHQQSSSNRAPSGRNTHLHDEVSTETAIDIELRKIIISLISVMESLLNGNPDTTLVCQQVYSRLKRRIANLGSKPVENSLFQLPPLPPIECTPTGIVVGLAEIRKREFHPNWKAFEILMEMGYTGEQIFEALRASKNSKEAAIKMLASGVTPEPIEAGIDPETHLFCALVSHPKVRLGLSSPKTLHAFLSILESPNSANIWLTDTDTAPVLSSIFKIYHSERHAANET